MNEPLEPRQISPFTHTDASAPATKKLGLELVIGSNVFRDTNGVVAIQGKEQLVIEFLPEQKLLLVTMDLYDTQGTQIAHLRRNVLMRNRHGQFAAEIHQPQHDMQVDLPWVRLLDRKSGSLVIEIRMDSAYRARILSGAFSSHQGMPVEITPNYCRIGSQRAFFGNIAENRGGMVLLGSQLSLAFPT